MAVQPSVLVLEEIWGELGRNKEFAQSLIRQGKFRKISPKQMNWVDWFIVNSGHSDRLPPERVTKVKKWRDEWLAQRGRAKSDEKQNDTEDKKVEAEETAEQDKVEAEIKDEQNQAPPVEIKTSTGKIVKLGEFDLHFHPCFMKLLRAASSRINGYAPGIFLSGEASSGKTTGGKQLAQVLELPWHFNGAISFPHEMLGFIDGNGHYHRTAFREAYEHGGVYTFDEVDRSDPVALLAVNPHLANGIATFPDGQIKRHKDCILMCTANTWGYGANADYSGATKLDAAFLSRFPVKIGWDIDLALESKIVGNDKWLARVRRARNRARSAGLKVMIDTRVGQAGAALIANGMPEEEAADMTYLAAVKPEQRRMIEDR